MRSATLVAALAALSTAVGCRSGSLESERSAPAPSTPSSSSYLPAGTSLSGELDGTLGTEQSRVGDTFTLTTVEPVRTTDGDVAVPTGSRISGTVTALEKSDRVGEPAVIALRVDHLFVEGREYPVEAEIVETDVELESESLEDTAKKAGVGAAAGVVLGAILSGADLDDMLLGGAVGAAAGTAISLGMGETNAALPEGTRLTVRLAEGVDLERRVSEGG